MTKRERLEDLGRLYEKLTVILERDIFEYTDSKHSYEHWVELNHNKIEYDEPRGLDYIFRTMRGLVNDLEECREIARGSEDD